MSNTKRNRMLFTIVLVLESLYLAVALVIPPLPGWKMFSHVEWVQQIDFRDDHGQVVPLEGYLPGTYYELSEALVQNVASFICRKHREVSKWSLKIEGNFYELQASDCLPRKK